MTFLRWGLIAALYVAGTGAGLAMFVAVLFSFLSELSWQFLAIGIGLFGYVYACGETMKHLKAHDDNPWLGIGIVLAVLAVSSPVIWKLAKI